MTRRGNGAEAHSGYGGERPLTLDQSSHAWRISSFCDKIDCVAVCRLEEGTIGITNTGDPDKRVLVVAAEALADWVESIKAGAFDDLI